MDRNCVVIYDACVLFPAPLRDLLMELGVLSHDKMLFRPKWTEQIHEEWISNLLKKRPDLKQEVLAATRKFMDSAFEDYEPLVNWPSETPAGCWISKIYHYVVNFLVLRW